MLEKCKRMRKKHYCSAIYLVLLILLVIWLTHPAVDVFNKDLTNTESLHTYKFSNDVIEFEKFEEMCYDGVGPSTLADLKKYVGKLNRDNAMCKRSYLLFQAVYQVFYRYGEIAISDTFMKKLEKWFKGNRELIEMTRNQSLVYIHNLYSFESVVINIVREKRPITGGVSSVLSYVDGLVKDSAATCSYCSYRNETATDKLERMESKHKFTVITASTFKADEYHSIAILKAHHPLKFTQAEFIDCMDLIMSWFGKAHTELPSHLYRVVYWDILPKAGAEQIHPVIHATLGDYSYHSRWNQLHDAALKFSKQHGGLNYWTSLLQIHTFLGLSYRFGKASLMAYLNPIKDAEIMVLSEKPCLDFFRLIYFTIRAFIDDIKLYALSMSISFPKIGTDFNRGDELPMMFRIVSRGSADSPRSDIGAFGFYGTVNVNRDPYKFIKQVKTSVEKQTRQPFSWDWDHHA